jgi:hypothetical protein
VKTLLLLALLSSSLAYADTRDDFLALDILNPCLLSELRGLTYLDETLKEAFTNEDIINVANRFYESPSCDAEIERLYRAGVPKSTALVHIKAAIVFMLKLHSKINGW